MKTPFEMINGDPVDLFIQEHRDIVMQRNKTLEKALKEGCILPPDAIKVNIHVEFDCLKCGSNVYEIHYEEFDNFIEFDPGQSVPHPTCSTCQTRYKYDHLDARFYPKIKQLHKFLKKPYK